MILIIDTASEKKFVAIQNNKTKKVFYFFDQNRISEDLERHFKKIFLKISPRKIKQVVVNLGLGPFTATRVGVSFANAFSFALKIPIIGVKNPKDLLKWTKNNYNAIIRQKKIHFVKPKYSQKPKITKSKRYF